MTCKAELSSRNEKWSRDKQGSSLSEYRLGDSCDGEVLVLIGLYAQGPIYAGYAMAYTKTGSWPTTITSFSLFHFHSIHMIIVALSKYFVAYPNTNS